MSVRSQPHLNLFFLRSSLRLSTVDYQLSSYFIFSNARTNASSETCTDPRNGLLMSAIANNASAIINEKNTTCTPCKNRFSDPNIQHETIVNTPPTTNTNHSTVGNDSAFSNNRVRRQVVIVLNSVIA